MRSSGAWTARLTCILHDAVAGGVQVCVEVGRLRVPRQHDAGLAGAEGRAQGNGIVAGLAVGKRYCLR